MTLKKDLFLATLSLDAYNQGYNSNFIHGETTIGSAVILADSLILNSDPNDPTRTDEAASFYAVAYDVPGGRVDGLSDSILISYRGTDDFSLFSPTSDILMMHLNKLPVFKQTPLKQG